MSHILELIDRIDPYLHYGELYEMHLRGQYKALAGVGSRSCDPKYKKYKPHAGEEITRRLMIESAAELERRKFKLRSGGALGADRFFEQGYVDKKNTEIYRTPGEKYSKAHHIDVYNKDIWQVATEIAKSVHPAWDRMDVYARDLHTRNAFQVLGRNLNMPVKFLICWTLKGESKASECTSQTGGTGTAIKIADNVGIPVFNLGNEAHRLRIAKWLDIDLQIILKPMQKDEEQQLLF